MSTFQKKLFILIAMPLGGCCSMHSSQEHLNEKLDTGDVYGALEEINNPCILKVPHIKTTKAMLMIRLSMDEKNSKEKVRLKKEALRILQSEAADGYPSAMDILDSYERLGDAYFVTFPWGGLIGPSVPIGQPRNY